MSSIYERLRTHLAGSDGWLIDGGAYQGAFTRLAGECPRLHVIAVEPNPVMAKVLRRIIEANKWTDRVDVAQAALGNHDGEGTLSIPPNKERWGHATTVPAFAADDWIPVPIHFVTIYELAREIRVDAIKLDVEGMELEALQGAAYVIDRDHPVLVIEYHEGRADTLAVLEWLRKRGYAWEVVDQADIWCWHE